MTLMIEYRNPTELVPHRLNARIYGETPDKTFVESVKAHGVVDPIHVTVSGTVISGHRRRHAAVVAKLRSVPVIVRHDIDDPLDVEKFLILANEQREKTQEQRVREAEELARILKALQTKDLHKRANLPTTDVVVQGRVRDQAAEAVGMSRRTFDAGAKVVAEIDRATEAGETERAEELREALNTKSVRAAVQKIEEPPKRAEVSEFGKRVMLLGQSYKVFAGHVAWLTANCTDADRASHLAAIDKHLAAVYRLICRLE